MILPAFPRVEENGGLGGESAPCGLNETLVEDKRLAFKGECVHFSFNKCPIYTHDGVSAKFSTNCCALPYKNIKKNSSTPALNI